MEKQFDFKKKVFTKRLKRLYSGKIADARDYEVERCKNLDMNLRFIVEGHGEQTFSPDEGVRLNERFIESKFGTKPYQLVSFFWKESEDQMELNLK